MSKDSREKKNCKDAGLKNNFLYLKFCINLPHGRGNKAKREPQVLVKIKITGGNFIKQFS